MKKVLSTLLVAVLLAGFGAVIVFAYPVTFNGNAPAGKVVTNLPADMDKTVGVALTLPATIPLCDGYEFKGWATSIARANAGTVDFTAGGIFPANEDAMNPRILYAVWEPNEYPVTFIGNPPPGGTVTGVPDPQIKEKGVPLTLSSEIPQCEGYAFAGWSTSPTGEAEFSAGGIYPGTSNAPLTLYAVWEANSFQITYDGNAPSGTATGVPAAQTKDRGTPLVLSDAIPTCPGYVFKGWATSAATANAGTVEFSASGVYSANAAATLYAVWQANTYTVIYDANGGVGTMAPSAHTYGTAKALTANAFTNPPGTFAGWSETATGVAKYTNGFSVSNLTAENGGEVTLYAVWSYPNKTTLRAKITEVEALEAWKYTAASWSDLEAELADARAVAANVNATQLEIDNAIHKLTLAQRKLAGRDFIFSTRHEATFMNWLLFIFAFGWVWMWFA